MSALNPSYTFIRREDAQQIQAAQFDGRNIEFMQDFFGGRVSQSLTRDALPSFLTPDQVWVPLRPTDWLVWSEGDCYRISDASFQKRYRKP